MHPMYTLAVTDRDNNQDRRKFSREVRVRKIPALARGLPIDYRPRLLPPTESRRMSGMKQVLDPQLTWASGTGNLSNARRTQKRTARVRFGDPNRPTLHQRLECNLEAP